MKIKSGRDTITLEHAEVCAALAGYIKQRTQREMTHVVEVEIVSSRFFGDANNQKNLTLIIELKPEAPL
jgi:hypothetical protein